MLDASTPKKEAVVGGSQYTKTYLKKVFRVHGEDRAKYKVVKMAVFCRPVIAEVHKVFYIVVCSDIVHVLYMCDGVMMV